MLTVRTRSRLWLWVERGLTNTEDMVYVRLVRTNDTVATTFKPFLRATTKARLWLMIVAADEIQNAVCTTIDYGFKPSSNSTLLTVEPQSTTATTPTKTPEQMEQEARASGWLTVWHEFLRIWEYPWYRLHFNCTMNGASVRCWISARAGLLGGTLAAFMSVSAAFITGMVATILASAFSSLFDTASLKAAVIAATAAMYVSVIVGMAALFLVPEPSSIAFKLAFP